MSINITKKHLMYACLGLVVAILFFIIFFTIPSNYKSRVEIKQTNISTNQKEKNTQPVKIAVFSDLQLGYDYMPKDMDILIDNINALKPDIVVFNGDLLAKDAKLSSKDEKLIVSNLEQLKPLYGKFAIHGDQDDGKGLDILFASGFEELNNQSRTITLNGQKINISGLLNKDYEKTLEKVKDNTTNIAFIHDPSLASKLSKYKLNAIVTAHTFGGQYNLPLFGSIYSELRKTAHYKGSKSENETLILSNNGIGINRGSMRFNAPSTIDILNIQ